MLEEVLDKVPHSLKKIKYIFLILFSIISLYMIATPDSIASISTNSTKNHRIVTINSNNKSIVHATRLTTPRDILSEINIVLHSGDVVTPEIDSIIEDKASSINIQRAIPVTVIVDDETTTIKTAYTSPTLILANIGKSIADEDKVTTEIINSPLDLGRVGKIVRVKRAIDVPINYGPIEYSLKTLEEDKLTISELLDSNEINYSGDSRLLNNPNEIITKNTVIDIEITSEQFETVTELIPFETEVITDYQKDIGYSEELTEGKNGEKVIEYKKVIVNGDITEQTIVKETITISPISRVIKKGGKSNYSGSAEYWRPYIEAAAAKYGSNPETLMRVMYCESRGDAQNYYGRSRGVSVEQALEWNNAIGLFQYKPTTWYGNGGGDIWNGYEQIELAAKMFADGQAWQWECK